MPMIGSSQPGTNFMHPKSADIVPFPLNRRRVMRGCPQCGGRSDVLPIGRLLWGYCEAHETRWVVADLHDVRPDRLDRRQLRRGLELLATYIEVSH